MRKIIVHLNSLPDQTFTSWIEACEYFDKHRWHKPIWIEIPLWDRIVINAHFKAMYNSGFPDWTGRFQVGKRYGIAPLIRQKWSHIFEFYGL